MGWTVLSKRRGCKGISGGVEENVRKWLVTTRASLQLWWDWLYYKMLPDKTLTQKTDDNKTLGFKQYKNHLTALLCCNSTGSHKLQPLIIRKFENPRCFHQLTEKPYRQYMTTQATLGWLRRFSKTGSTRTLFQLWKNICARKNFQ